MAINKLQLSRVMNSDISQDKIKKIIITYIQHYKKKSKTKKMKQQEVRKNCQIFMNKLQNTAIYENVKNMLLNWKKEDKNHNNVLIAIDIFVKITKMIYDFSQDEKDDRIKQFFNRCLVKQAIVPKKIITSDFVQEIAYQNPQSHQIIDKVQELIKKQNKNNQKIVNKPTITIEEIKDNALLSRFESLVCYRDVIKILQLYLKSIISFEELRELLNPLFTTDPSLITYIVQTSQELIQKRRRATIFSPLNQLVDKKYPNLYQVGESYILIPEGYANYSKTWKTNKLQYIMNRKYVSVPLGSEVSFIINKKTDYEEQLFNYQDQRYEIDSALSTLSAAVGLFESNVQHCLDSPLLQRIINELYPNENVANIFIRNPEISRIILFPRIIQKKQELMQCRQKFIKICEEVAIRNFYKSLDYRCFYFAKNDKKFNCSVRWEKEIEMRKKQIQENKDVVLEQQIEDRQSLQRGRYFYINSFDNITKQNFIQNKQTSNIFNHKTNTKYPIYPQNQILFIINFMNEDILNDVLEIILYYCTRKNLLELLIFKIMRTDIKKRIKKLPLLNYLIQTKQKIVNNPQVIQILANINSPNYSKLMQQQGYPPHEQLLLNDGKGLTKAFKDSQDQFLQMIEEDEEPVQIQNEECPFEGPSTGYTFIGTKQMYIFMRFVTAIYQRFLKAREYSQQLLNHAQRSEENKSQINIYQFFINILIYKIKDRKYFEEYLRKLFCKNAFIFFTLQKMILSAAKTINNINIDSLSYKIIKDQTKDYELGAFDWEKYTFPTVTMQLTRLYLEQETLFRFTYEPEEKNFYISAWMPPFKESLGQGDKMNGESNRMEKYMIAPTAVRGREKYKNIRKKQKIYQLYNGEQITRLADKKLILKGEYIIVNRQKNERKNWEKLVKIELNKIKNIKNVC